MNNAQTWALVALLAAVFGGQLALTWKLIGDVSSRVADQGDRITGLASEVAGMRSDVKHLSDGITAVTQAVMKHLDGHPR